MQTWPPFQQSAFSSYRQPLLLSRSPTVKPYQGFNSIVENLGYVFLISTSSYQIIQKCNWVLRKTKKYSKVTIKRNLYHGVREFFNYYKPENRNFEIVDCLWLYYTVDWRVSAWRALGSTALLRVDFGSHSQSRIPDFNTIFVKKSTLKWTLLDFKSGKSDLDSTPPQWSTPSPQALLGRLALPFCYICKMAKQMHAHCRFWPGELHSLLMHEGQRCIREEFRSQLVLVSTKQ